MNEKRWLISRSPAVFLSLAACSWSIARVFIQVGLPRYWRVFPLDFPLFVTSPIATPLNMAFTIFWVSLFGVVMGLIGVCRKGEAWRWWGFAGIIINIVAHLASIKANLWALFPPPGVDY